MRSFFVVEYEDGERLENGEGGYTCWTTSTEAQDEADSACADVPLKVVEYREVVEP